MHTTTATTTRKWSDDEEDRFYDIFCFLIFERAHSSCRVRFGIVSRRLCDFHLVAQKMIIYAVHRHRWARSQCACTTQKIKKLKNRKKKWNFQHHTAHTIVKVQVVARQSKTVKNEIILFFVCCRCSFHILCMNYVELLSQYFRRRNRKKNEEEIVDTNKTGNCYSHFGVANPPGSVLGAPLKPGKLSAPNGIANIWNVPR